MKTRFQQFKAEILKRAREAGACVREYRRACNSENFNDLMQVIKDNFSWACDRKVITADIVKNYESDFGKAKVWCNANCKGGYLFVESSTVEAWGNSTVYARGSSTVYAWDNSTVEAWENSTVEARDNSTVEARDNSTVYAMDKSTVYAWDSPTVYARENSTVYAWDSSTVEARENSTVYAWDSSTVEARDNSYITSNSTKECKISDNAIYRIRESNTIRFASDGIKFEKCKG